MGACRAGRRPLSASFPCIAACDTSYCPKPVACPEGSRPILTHEEGACCPSQNCSECLLCPHGAAPGTAGGGGSLSRGSLARGDTGLGLHCLGLGGQPALAVVRVVSAALGAGAAGWAAGREGGSVRLRVPSWTGWSVCSVNGTLYQVRVTRKSAPAAHRKPSPACPRPCQLLPETGPAGRARAPCQPGGTSSSPELSRDHHPQPSVAEAQVGPPALALTASAGWTSPDPSALS